MISNVQFGSVTGSGIGGYATDPNKRKLPEEQNDQLSFSGSAFAGWAGGTGATTDASTMRGRAAGCSFDMNM